MVQKGKEIEEDDDIGFKIDETSLILFFKHLPEVFIAFTYTT